ncbi:MAG: AtpZ/AtpI family protein [Bacteroidetes bacterium]|nr:MAG: AtpZ/AtpI family protein [Bacteroidota bacterium]
MESKQQPNKNNYSDLLRYSALGTQIFVALGLAVFIGLKVDKWLKISAPLLVLILPIVVLAGIIYKIVKETSKQKNGNAKK